MNRVASEGGDWTRLPPDTRVEDAAFGVGPNPAQPPVITISELLGALRRYIGLLALWLAICIGIAAYYLHVTPAEYTANATVILEAKRQVGVSTDGGAVGYPPTLDNAQTESEIQVIKSERILAEVFNLLDLQKAPELAPQGPGLREQIESFLHLSRPPADQKLGDEARATAFQNFANRVGARRIGQSYVLEVSYRAGTPEQAARIANAVTSAYIRSQIDIKAAAAQRGTEYLQERITGIQAEQEAALEGIKQGRIPDVQFPDSDARVIGAALLPLSKSFPQNGLVLAFSATLGLLTGLLAVAARVTLDRRLKTRQQVQQTLGVTCLGAIPDAGWMRDVRTARKFPGLAQAVITFPGSRFAHAIRSARTAILASAPAGRHHAIGVVSFSPGEGRSIIASNLAHLMAVSSDFVELIDGDLRNPALTATLAPDADSGLTEALTDFTPAAALPSVTLSPRLGFIPAIGSGRSSDPNVYLGSAEMESLLQEWRVDRDVVIDLPPLSISSDAQALSPFLDGIILVVQAERTKVEEAAEAIRELRAANARILGVILNRIRA